MICYFLLQNQSVVLNRRPLKDLIIQIPKLTNFYPLPIHLYLLLYICVYLLSIHLYLFISLSTPSSLSQTIPRLFTCIYFYFLSIHHNHFMSLIYSLLSLFQSTFTLISFHPCLSSWLDLLIL